MSARRDEVGLSVQKRIDEELDSIIDAGDVNRIGQLQATVRERPGYADLRYALAHLHYLSGAYAAALRELEEAKIGRAHV